MSNIPPIPAVEEYTPDGWQPELPEEPPVDPEQSVSPQSNLVATWGSIK